MRLLPRYWWSEGHSRDPGIVTLAEAPSAIVSPDQSSFLETIGWLSAALGAVAVGLIVGREIRQRYKFNRRTPYDLYSHSGDQLPDVEFGVGI